MRSVRVAERSVLAWSPKSSSKPSIPTHEEPGDAGLFYACALRLGTLMLKLPKVFCRYLFVERKQVVNDAQPKNAKRKEINEPANYLSAVKAVDTKNTEHNQ